MLLARISPAAEPSRGSWGGRVVRGYRLGIDFGTSNTVAVLSWPDRRVKPAGAATIAQTGVFGDVCRNSRPTSPPNVVRPWRHQSVSEVSARREAWLIY
jgi:hypothetical protein